MNYITPMLSSPLKWVGGKSKLRRQVIERIPDGVECYAEVFGGACWVLFGKEVHPLECINDVNGDLVNLWRVLKWRSAELLEEVHQYLYSREMFMELREAQPLLNDEMGRAVRYYLLLQMAFAADLSRSRTASFGFRNKARGALFLNKSLEQFKPAQERLRNVFIERLDFADLIRRYDQEKSLFFCDPPYLNQAGYEAAFTLKDHERLAQSLHGIKGRFLLTVNDHPAIRELYAGCELEEAKEARALARASSGRQAASILFISNYASVTQARIKEAQR